MDTIRLRTMTYKSVFIGGRHDGMTVHQILSMDRYRYLRNVYFTYDSLTFIDEILDLINIPKEYRIEKPGTNKDFNKELNDKYDKYTDAGNLIPTHFFNENQFKTKRMNKIKKDRIKYSKGSLQARNHGH